MMSFSYRVYIQKPGCVCVLVVRLKVDVVFEFCVEGCLELSHLFLDAGELSVQRPDLLVDLAAVLLQLVLDAVLVELDVRVPNRKPTTGCGKT